MRGFLAVALGLLTLLGCSAIAEPAKTLARSTVVIDTSHGPVRFTVEVAGDRASQERGLMYRKELSPDAGMLFDFHRPVMTSFWMKNTLIPLDMIFIRTNGTISTIHANAQPYSLTPIPSAEPVRAVLEIKGGRARELAIQPGDQIHTSVFGQR